MILAAIPAVAQFIGFGLIGRRYPFIGWVRMGLGTSLLRAVFSYILSLVMVYVFALIINALAPTFASTPNQLNAMKLAVYSMTPGWVAGILYIVPFLEWLVILASLYGLYVLYLGFATPHDGHAQGKGHGLPRREHRRRRRALGGGRTGPRSDLRGRRRLPAALSQFFDDPSERVPPVTAPL